MTELPLDTGAAGPSNRRCAGGPRSWPAPIALSAVLVAVYWAGSSNGFVYDDYEVILRQPRPAGGLQVLKVFSEPHFCDLPYYRPVTRATLLFQKYLHDDSPRPFHLVNIGLAILAFWLARAILGLPALGVRPPFALAGAFLFAVHPVMSSCVYPIASGRETLLPGVLVLASFYAFAQRGHVVRIGSLLLFALALFSKESAVMALPVMVVADVLGISERQGAMDWRRRAASYGPFVIVIVAYFVIRFTLFHGREYALAMFDRPGAFALSFVFALQAVFAPFVELVYEPRPGIWASGPRLVIAASGALLAAILALVLRRRQGGALVCFWALWILLFLLPTSNLLRQETPFAERYAFPAILGVIGLIACGLSNLHFGRRARQLAMGSVVVATCAATGITVYRARFYRDSVTFCQQWLLADPEAVNAHTHLGYLSLEAGDLPTATGHFERALALAPDHAGAMVLLAGARMMKGSNAEAVALASEALARDPQSADAQSVLAEALGREGRREEAISEYSQLLARNPYRVDARFNRAVLLFELGRGEEAIAEYSTLLEAHPDHAAARANLGRALAGERRFEEAVAQYREALRLNPDDPRTHGNLANVLAVQGKVGEARLHYREVLRLDPGSAEAHFNLAMLAASQRAFVEARDHFRAALDLRPGSTEPALRLAWILATCPEDAVRDPAEAVRLAEGVCGASGCLDPRPLDVLAAAYAATGRFTDAARTAQRALDHVEPGDDGSVAEQIRERLTLYESGRSYVEVAR